ncbi:MAG: dihydrofolate reductase family protein [Bdellovibrio sp.]
MSKPLFPKISVYIAMSLDGYIATENNSLDWLRIVRVEGEDYGYGEFFSTVDTIVMGRNTYDVVKEFSYWPYENKKVFVATHSPPNERKYNEQFFAGSLKEQFHLLAENGSKHVYLDGGQLIMQGLQEGLVDDLTVSIIPILLGKGIPLFKKIEKEIKLVSTQPKYYNSGLAQLKYYIEK